MAFSDTARKVLANALALWGTPVLSFEIRNGKAYVKLLPELQTMQPLDKRIAQIDTAKESLLAAISAIDEMKVEAEKNKADLQKLTSELTVARSEKKTVSVELDQLRTVAQAEIDAFRKLAGVPTSRQIAVERFIGFIIGVAASLAATLIWYLATKGN